MVVWGGPNDTLAPPKTAFGGAAAMRPPPPSYAPGPLPLPPGYATVTKSISQKLNVAQKNSLTKK